MGWQEYVINSFIEMLKTNHYLDWQFERQRLPFAPPRRLLRNPPRLSGRLSRARRNIPSDCPH